MCGSASRAAEAVSTASSVTEDPRFLLARFAKRRHADRPVSCCLLPEMGSCCRFAARVRSKCERLSSGVAKSTSNAAAIGAIVFVAWGCVPATPAYGARPATSPSWLAYIQATSTDARALCPRIARDCACSVEFREHELVVAIDRCDWVATQHADPQVQLGPLCIADWGCAPGLACDMTRFECDDVSGEPDHKPNPFDEARKPNPFAD